MDYSFIVSFATLWFKLEIPPRATLYLDNLLEKLTATTPLLQNSAPPSTITFGEHWRLLAKATMSIRSATQFYVVWGKRWTPNDLANVREHVDAETGENDVITDNMALDYYTRGGSPHLDGQYTVFGEVLEGLEVIGKIQGVATDRNDRPRVDVRIISARIVPVPELQTSVR